MATAHGFLGDDDAAAEQHGLAMTDFDRVIAPAPTAAEPRFAKAAALINRAAMIDQLGRPKEAIEVLKQAQATLNGIRDGQDDAKSRELLAMASRVLGQAVVNDGQADVAVKHLEDAVAGFRELSDANPDHPQYVAGLADSHVSLAVAYRQTGQAGNEEQAYETAIQDYLDLIESRPDIPRYRENLALTKTDLAQLLHAQQGRNAAAADLLDEALNTFQRLIGEAPDHPQYLEEAAVALSILGQVLLDLGDAEAARAELEEAVQVLSLLVQRSDAPIYRRRLALSEISLARVLVVLQLPDEAAELFQKAIMSLEQLAKAAGEGPLVDNELAGCCVSLGRFLWDSGDQVAASKRFRQADGLWTGLAGISVADFRLAELLTTCPDVGIQDPPQALTLATTLVARVPLNSQYQRVLGVALFRSGMYPASIKQLKIAAGMHSDATTLFFLAMAHARNSDPAQAATALTTAEKKMQATAPGSPRLHRIRDEALELINDASR